MIAGPLSALWPGSERRRKFGAFLVTTGEADKTCGCRDVTGPEKERKKKEKKEGREKGGYRVGWGVGGGGWGSGVEP